MTTKALIPDLQRFARIGKTDARGVISFSPRQIYILPSRYGLIFCILIAIILIGSINSASNLGFLSGFLLASIGLVSMVLTWWNLVGINITPLSPKAVFAGQEALFPVQIHNSRNQQRPGLMLAPSENTGHESLLDLNAQVRKTISVPRATVRRGLINAGRFRLYTYYPLGLFYAWCYLDTDQECLVYPRPADTAPLLTSPEYSGAESGDRGRGADDFIGHRDYRRGDSQQHIDWKVAARERGLVCKLFGGDRADRLSLDWDALPEVGTEERLQLLCRAILDAEEARLDYSLRLPATEIPAAHGSAHLAQCLTALALFGTGNG